MKNSGSSSAITTPRPAPRQPDGVIQPRDSADSRRQSFALTGRSVDLDLGTNAVRRDIADIRLAEHVFAPHYAVPMIRLVARTATLRAINAVIKDRDITARGEGKPPLSDDDLLVVLQKMVKQREESFGIYAQAGRNDLATIEKEEIDIIAEFLPKALNEAEVDAAIEAAIARTGAAGGKDMGKVIAQLKVDYPGRIDFGKASGKVRAALSA